jgi:hypothetical protein
MEDVNIDSVIPQPPRQPESVASGLVRDGNAPDLAPLPDCLVAPAMQELKQAIRVRTLLLPRLTLDPGDNAGDEPARLAELHDSDNANILLKRYEGLRQIVHLRHLNLRLLGQGGDGRP